MSILFASDSDHLSQITTEWSAIEQAHRCGNPSPSDAQATIAAQQTVLNRYGGSIYRYLLGATRDANVAEELAQEFAYRFIRGDLRNVSPQQGRFRDYLKAVLRNIANDHFRRRRKEQRMQVNLDSRIAGEVDAMEQIETEFKESWRQDMLNLIWAELKKYQLRKSNSYYTVLRFRAENPEMDSGVMAGRLSVILAREVTAEWVRQNLHRARTKFSELLVKEISRTLSPDATREEIDRELAELRLLKYV